MRHKLLDKRLEISLPHRQSGKRKYVKKASLDIVKARRIFLE